MQHIAARARWLVAGGNRCLTLTGMKTWNIFLVSALALALAGAESRADSAAAREIMRAVEDRDVEIVRYSNQLRFDSNHCL